MAYTDVWTACDAGIVRYDLAYETERPDTYSQPVRVRFRLRTYLRSSQSTFGFNIYTKNLYLNENAVVSDSLVKNNTPNRFDFYTYYPSETGWFVVNTKENSIPNIKLEMESKSNNQGSSGDYATDFTSISCPAYIEPQAVINRCDNFNSNSNPYMEFTNPGGLPCNLRLEFGNTSISRNNYYGNGAYEFQLSNEERDLLYSKCSDANTLSVRYVVATIINGVEAYWSYYDRIMYVVNSNPIFSNCTYKDIGTASTVLTGNNQVLIKGYNVLEVTISTGNKAVAVNGATINRYKLVCGNKITEASYSSNSEVKLILYDIASPTFIVYAIDSRENSIPVTKTVATWKEYSNIEIKQGGAIRTEAINETVQLNFNGSIWNDTFGITANSIISCTYKYKKTSENTYTNGTTQLVPTINGNNFSLEANITGDTQNGFLITNSYNIQIIITDKIRTDTFDILLGAGKPAMAIHKNGVAFGAPYNESAGGDIQVGGEKLRICIGSQVLYADEVDGRIVGSSITLLGTYNYELIEKIFQNVTIPQGYHKEYRLTFQGSTGTCSVQVGLNNIWTEEVMTWSAKTFRRLASSAFFKESDIELHQTYQYQNLGINLGIRAFSAEGYSDATSWNVWNITLHGYLVAD